MVSVHDPDEYLDNAVDDKQTQIFYHDILEAYRALGDLKKEGHIEAIGVGAKNWRTIKQICKDVDLDWVMIANSMTIKSHPNELLDFMKELEERGVAIINSAVFHSGFLTGSDYFDYRKVSSETDFELYKWRHDFFSVCKKYDVNPAAACVQFASQMPGVRSIALNTTNPKRVKENIQLLDSPISAGFWRELRDKKIISADVLLKTQLIGK